MEKPQVDYGHKLSLLVQDWSSQKSWDRLSERQKKNRIYKAATQKIYKWLDEGLRNKKPARAEEAEELGYRVCPHCKGTGFDLTCHAHHTTMKRYKKDLEQYIDNQLYIAKMNVLVLGKREELATDFDPIDRFGEALYIDVVDRLSELFKFLDSWDSESLNRSGSFYERRFEKLYKLRILEIDPYCFCSCNLGWTDWVSAIYKAA